MPCLVSSLDDSESDAGHEAAVAHAGAGAGASGAQARSGGLLDFVSDSDADTEAAEVGAGVDAAEGGAGACVAEAIADAGDAEAIVPHVAIADAGDAEAIVPQDTNRNNTHTNMRQLQSTTLAYTCWATASPGSGKLLLLAGGAGAPRPSGRSWRRS